MTSSLFLFLLLSALCCFTHAFEDYHSISVTREWADNRVVNALRKRQHGRVHSKIGHSLYWFGHWTTGDTKDLKLLIDTGSSDCIPNNGLYKPSKYEKPYEGNKTFSITYEGVNRAGFGFETINGTVQRDIVTSGNLTVWNQALGSAKSFKYFDVKPLPFANPGQGIIGFLGPQASSFEPGAPSWFYNLCDQKLIKHCRFGLAFGTSGKGKTIVGDMAKKLIKGKPVVLPRIKPYSAYNVIGDVTLNNTIVARNQTFIMDVGTDNIQGPVQVTKQIFESLGWQHILNVEKPTSFAPGVSIKVLDGYFPCDKPPVLGFSFPAQSALQKGEKATIFNVSPKVWDVYDHGNNNCTSILGGTNAVGSQWLIGQSFFAGHYIDFSISEPQTVSFADLVEPSG